MSSTTIDNEPRSLLRGEIAAAETYQQVLEGTDEAGAAQLRELQNDHGDAIRYLYDQLKARGVEAPASSGIWGGLARVVEGTAMLFGDRAALTALREGERRGLESYQRALNWAELPDDVREHITRQLLPAQRRHVDALDRLLAPLQ